MIASYAIQTDAIGLPRFAGIIPGIPSFRRRVEERKFGGNGMKRKTAALVCAVSLIAMSVATACGGNTAATTALDAARRWKTQRATH